MDAATEKKALEASLEVWSVFQSNPPKHLEVANAFVAMIKEVDHDPESILANFNDYIDRSTRLRYRNKLADLGMEVTPDQIQTVIDLYKLAYATWEKLKYEK